MRQAIPSPVAVKVSTESSETIVSLVTPGPTYNTSATTIPYGSPYVLRMDVTNSSGHLAPHEFQRPPNRFPTPAQPET